VSGYGREALPQGFQDTLVVRKPVNNDELIAVIERLSYKPPGVIQLRRTDPAQ